MSDPEVQRRTRLQSPGVPTRQLHSEGLDIALGENRRAGSISVHAGRIVISEIEDGDGMAFAERVTSKPEIAEGGNGRRNLGICGDGRYRGESRGNNEFNA